MNNLFQVAHQKTREIIKEAEEHLAFRINMEAAEKPVSDYMIKLLTKQFWALKNSYREVFVHTLRMEASKRKRAKQFPSVYNGKKRFLTLNETDMNPEELAEVQRDLARYGCD